MNKHFDLNVVRTCGSQVDKTIHNPLCVDKMIHVRFKGYGDKREIVYGFEKKLTFLMTLLFHCKFPDFDFYTERFYDTKIKDVDYDKVWESYCSKLLDCSTVQEIESIISKRFKAFKGIKLSKSIARHENEICCGLFGYISSSLSLTNDNGLTDNLLVCLGIDDLEEFLFDNSIYLTITPVSDRLYYQSKFDTKFKNKEVRKTERLSREKSKLVYKTLWC